MSTAGDALVLASRLTEIDGARRWLAGHAAAAGFDKEAVWALELALTEALSNVILHSYEGDPDQRIELFVAVDEKRFCVEIRDSGLGFDPAGYAEPDLGSPQAGGYGVYLMRQLMDEVVSAPLPGRGTTLRLVKYRLRSGDD